MDEPKVEGAGAPVMPDTPPVEEAPKEEAVVETPAESVEATV